MKSKGPSTIMRGGRAVPVNVGSTQVLGAPLRHTIKTSMVGRGIPVSHHEAIAEQKFKAKVAAAREVKQDARDAKVAPKSATSAPDEHQVRYAQKSAHHAEAAAFAQRTGDHPAYEDHRQQSEAFAHAAKTGDAHDAPPPGRDPAMTLAGKSHTTRPPGNPGPGGLSHPAADPSAHQGHTPSGGAEARTGHELAHDPSGMRGMVRGAARQDAEHNASARYHDRVSAQYADAGDRTNAALHKAAANAHGAAASASGIDRVYAAHAADVASTRANGPGHLNAHGPARESSELQPLRGAPSSQAASQTGVRGGQFHIGANGAKVYDKK